MAQNANVAALQQSYPQRIHSSGEMIADAEWALTGSLTLNRFIPMFRVPAGVRIRNIIWDFPILDTNGSPLVQYSIGISGTPALFAATVTPGAAASKGNTIATAGLNYITTSEITVGITIAVAAATTNASPLTPLYVGLAYKDQ